MRRAMSRLRHCLLFFTFVSVHHAQPVTAEDFLERAREHFERRRFLNALDSLRVTLQMPGDKNTLLEAEVLSAEALLALGRHEEAVNMYERAIEHGYAKPEAYAYLAVQYDDRGKWSQARKFYEKYLAVNKSDSATHIRYAIVLGRQGERQAARQVLETIEPAVAAVEIAECDALEKKQKIPLALACFDRAKLSRPDREVSYLALYRIAAAAREPKAAARHALALYALFGSEARYIWPLVEVRLAERRFYDARLLLEEIIRITGENADAERLLSNLQRQAPQAFVRPYRASPKEMQMLNGYELR
jgi:tetratricopeptide (TPR) repeat protein